jgi:hypothetical protein
MEAWRADDQHLGHCCNITVNILIQTLIDAASSAFVHTSPGEDRAISGVATEIDGRLVAEAVEVIATTSWVKKLAQLVMPAIAEKSEGGEYPIMSNVLFIDDNQCEVKGVVIDRQEFPDRLELLIDQGGGHRFRGALMKERKGD